MTSSVIGSSVAVLRILPEIVDLGGWSGHGLPQIGLQHLDGKCFMGIVIHFSQNQKHRISNCNLERRLRQRLTMESVEQCVVAENATMYDIYDLKRHSI